MSIYGVTYLKSNANFLCTEGTCILLLFFVCFIYVCNNLSCFSTIINQCMTYHHTKNDTDCSALFQIYTDHILNHIFWTRICYSDFLVYRPRCYHLSHVVQLWVLTTFCCLNILCLSFENICVINLYYLPLHHSCLTVNIAQKSCSSI